MKIIFGLFLLSVGILFAVFAYNNLVGRNLDNYYNAVISDKLIKIVHTPFSNK